MVVKRPTASPVPLMRALLAMSVFVILARLIFWIAFDKLGLNVTIHAASSSLAAGINLAFDFLLVVASLALYKWVDRANIESVGLRLSTRAFNMTSFCLGLLLAQYLLVMMVTGLTGATWSFADFSMSSVFRAVIVMLGVGVGEEFLFRGYIFNTLRSYGRLSAYLVSCLIFAMAHFVGEPFHFLRLLGTFLPGLLFTYIYEQSGSIWPGSIVHATMNLFSLLFIHQVSGVSLMAHTGTGNSSLVEIVWFISYTLMLVLLALVVRRTYKPLQQADLELL